MCALHAGLHGYQALYVAENTMAEYTGGNWDEIKAQADEEIRRIDDSHTTD